MSPRRSSLPPAPPGAPAPRPDRDVPPRSAAAHPRPPGRHCAAARTLALAGLLATIAACGGDAPPPPSDDATVLPTDTAAAVAAVPPPPSPWRSEEAGPLVAVAGTTPRTALLVLPEYTDSTVVEVPARDVTALVPLPVELFARRGRVGTGTLVAAEPRGTSACPGWPVAELRADDGAPIAPWQVALGAGLARAIPLDSIEALPPADSARLAADLARLASLAVRDTASAFRGLPWVVRTARLFPVDSATRAVAALLTRRLSTEATPLAEQLLLVAERPAAAPPRTPWRLAYRERASGPEETVETSDVLAALHIGPTARPSLILGRDYGDGVAYALVERTAGGEWTLRWSSAYVGGC